MTTRHDSELSQEIANAEDPNRGLRRWLRRTRSWVDRHPWASVAYKTLVAGIGAALILAGIVMLVVPGPGWVTIFLGLAILATEFRWARRLSDWLRIRLQRLWSRRRTKRSRGSDA